MEEDTAYTLALWRVKEGGEEEFVEAWKGLSDYFLDLPNPPGCREDVVQRHYRAGRAVRVDLHPERRV